MAKGATAKLNVENKIKEAFGADYTATVDKKIYVWADDGGEKVQVCITMTCPKTPVGTTTSVNTGLDFETMTNPATTASSFQPAEITHEETENIKNMLARLGL